LDSSVRRAVSLGELMNWSTSSDSPEARCERPESLGLSAGHDIFGGAGEGLLWGCAERLRLRERKVERERERERDSLRPLGQQGL
jgi:hypothetical protein